MPRGSRVLATAVAVTVAMSTAACSGGGADDAGRAGGPDGASDGSTPVLTYPTVAFSTIDDQVATRVASTGMTGSVLLVVQDQGVLHLTEAGGSQLDSVVPVTDAGALLTSLVALRLVDQGRLGLDDEVATTLVRWRGVLLGTTVRDLLGHTSTLPVDLSCPSAPEVAVAPDRSVWSPGTACDAALDTASPRPATGERGFRISPADYHVLVRLIEAVTGEEWTSVVRRELLEPLGLTQTGPALPQGAFERAASWLGTDAFSTPGEWGRLMALVLARGQAPDGTRIVSDASIRAMEADHTDRLDTHLEPWVGWTGVPTFGLGVWRDRLRSDGSAAQISVVGRNGFVGWVDRQRNAWGVLAVDQPANAGDPGAAIRASTGLVQGPMQPAVDTEGRPLRRPGGVVIGSDGQPVVPDDTP